MYEIEAREFLLLRGKRTARKDGKRWQSQTKKHDARPSEELSRPPWETYEGNINQTSCYLVFFIP